MTKDDLEAVFDRVRAWSPEKQRVAMEALLWFEDGDDIYELSPEERADLEEGLAELDRGEVATDDEVAAVFARFGK